MSDAQLRLKDDGQHLVVSAGEIEIATYEYRPLSHRSEAPKPFLHPIRSVTGAPLSVARPWDHRWHKGLQMTWSHISGENFWGGPTFSIEEGYTWRENLGRIEHTGFRRADDEGGSVRVDEDLRWFTHNDRSWLTEERSHVFRDADLDRGSWVLDFKSRLVNVADRELRLGSPTTHGRSDAGYTGLFWRGPRSWTGGDILAAGGVGAQAVMGSEAEWAAVTGQHDEIDGGGTVLMFAGTSSAEVPIRWFARNEPFACLAPSPAFDTEIVLVEGGQLDLSHRVVFLDHVYGPDQLEQIAEELRP